MDKSTIILAIESIKIRQNDMRPYMEQLGRSAQWDNMSKPTYTKLKKRYDEFEVAIIDLTQELDKEDEWTN